FQAEDGIRDFHVTGVQTCALPIYPCAAWVFVIKETHFAKKVAVIKVGDNHFASFIIFNENGYRSFYYVVERVTFIASINNGAFRSEERRVGKEYRAWCSRGH